MSYPQKQVNDLLNDSGFPSRWNFFAATLLRRLAVATALLGANLPQESNNPQFFWNRIRTRLERLIFNLPQTSHKAQLTFGLLVNTYRMVRNLFLIRLELAPLWQ